MLVADGAMADEPPVRRVEPAASAPARPAGTVRLHFKSYKGKTVARLYAADPSKPGAYAFVCQSPCAADVNPGTPLRVTLGDAEDEPHDLVMLGNAGSDVDYEVRPAARGMLAGGIVMTSIGGLTALVGLVLFAVGATSSTFSELEIPGFVCMGVGAGLTAGGLALISGRSHEPRVEEAPHDREALLARWRTAEARSPTMPLPPAFAPLSWTIKF
jgi:hypothetical protein